MRIPRPRSRITAVVLTVAALVLGTLLPMSATSASAATALPLGKADYVMSVGGLKASSTANWVRLGLYTFATDGTVSERHWHWSQKTRVTRTNTGFVSDLGTPRNCNIKTAGGYDSTAAEQFLTGTYTVSAGTLHVAWSSGQWEDWTITLRPDGALADAELAGNNFGATHGFGNGSNAAWSTRASMATIHNTDWTKLIHRYYLWKTTAAGQPPFIDTGDGAHFWALSWKTCTSGSCLGTETSSETEYYIAPANSPTGHRRDTLWHWVRALADARGEFCYTGNSHVKPMLQVIDDNGVFHGWVGVEASLNQTTSEGALGDDIGVFRILDQAATT